MPRRRSIDSSSSSPSSDSDTNGKRPRQEKHRHKEEDRSLHVPPILGGSQQHFNLPPAYAPPERAPSGDRIALTFPGPFPTNQAGPHVCVDADGSPVYIGSALGSNDPRDPLHNTVHPCKIAPHLSPPCRVPYGGIEHGHTGRYDLLPIVAQTMEWVPTSFGRIPQNKLPIEGGIEHGTKLYHALAKVGEVWVPGKTGAHLVCPPSCFARNVDLIGSIIERVQCGLWRWRTYNQRSLSRSVSPPSTSAVHLLTVHKGVGDKQIHR